METKEDLIWRATPASWWKRLLAWFIDLFCILIMGCFIGFLIGNVGTTTTHYQIYEQDYLDKDKLNVYNSKGTKVGYYKRNYLTGNWAYFDY
jgi:hypothetical protein